MIDDTPGPTDQAHEINWKTKEWNNFFLDNTWGTSFSKKNNLF